MEIKVLRAEIDRIDEQMLVLFKQRMAISKQIGDFKVKNNLPIYDQTREEAMIKKYELIFNDEVLWPYYEQFIRHMMTLSKALQK